MKKTKILLIFTAFLLLLSACQNASLRSASQGVNAHPALWKAKSSQGVVYLLGSAHALSPRVKWYGDKIQKAFESSDELVLETVVEDNDEESFEEIDRKFGLIKNGKLISDYLTKPEYAKYKKIAKAINLNSYKADRMQPWLFSLIVGSVLNETPSQYGVDLLFYRAAKAKNMKISSVETSYHQMAALASTPFSQQIRELKETLNNKSVDLKKVHRQKQMLYAWATGDTNRASKLLTQGISPAYYYHLIIKRNNRWYPKIKSLLAKKQTTMVVVGLAHLIGRGNIIDKLKASGYKPKRLQ